MVARAGASAGIGQPQIVGVAKFNEYDNTANKFSDGTKQSNTSRLVYTLAVDCTDVQFVFANSADDSETDLTAGRYPVTVAASVEQGAGFYPLQFGGPYSVLIPNGASVICDPVSLLYKAADTLPVRTYASTSVLGQPWALNRTAWSESGSGIDSGATDKTRSGTITASTGYCLGPALLLGRTHTPVKSVIAIGDSITSHPNSGADFSWFETAMGTAIPAMNFAVSGFSCASWLSQKWRRTAWMRYATDVICALGANDLGVAVALASVQPNFIALWRMIAQAGPRVYQTTITPRATSSDSFATLANQTAANVAVPSFNDWVRDGAPLTVSGSSLTAAATSATGATVIRAGAIGHPLAGYIENADVVESARNSGKWKVDGTANKYTSDGLHPTVYAHGLMGAAFNTARFV